MINYKMCKLVKENRKVKVYAFDGKEWVSIFKTYTIQKVEDAKLLIDHHLQK